ncbi:MAG: hypothetical protein HYY06_28670 [Deltaproteobacteria bacterium]|nr:hypothetical protein [Deltaproteobacteria bacterium]
MRISRLALVAVGVVILGPSGGAKADSIPEDGYWESEGICEVCAGTPPFNWRFADPWNPEQNHYYYLSYASPDANYSVYPFGWFPYTYITNNRSWYYPWIQQSQWHVDEDYNQEGFHTDAITWPEDGWNPPDVAWSRWVWVPSSGGNFARVVDKWTNTGESDAESLTLVQYGSPSATGGVDLNVIATGDGDTTIEVADHWAVFDDEDGDGMPAAAIVWSGQDAELQPSTVTVAVYDWGRNDVNVTYSNVTIPAGSSVSLAIFMVQANTQAEAQAQAEELVDMGGAASDYLDVGEIDESLANFIPGSATGPRLRTNGPYSCDEGGEVQLDVTVTDGDGGDVTWIWDLDGDGSYDDRRDVSDPTISCATADGPQTLRVPIEMDDREEDPPTYRNVSIAVRNLAPVVSSTPPTEATTDEELTYQIVATDFAADEILYEIDEGPQGMTVSNSGLVRWTPPGNGIGPQVPVTVLVSDDDGDEVEHSWVIDMQGGPVVVPGGPYRCPEGGDVLLQPDAFDPEGEELTYAWDLDGDGVFDDWSEPTATWSAAGIDGPQDGFVVRLVVSDGEYDVQAQIPIQVQNAPPEFISVPPATAVVAREWRYEIECQDPGGDTFEITVEDEDLPVGMEFDEVNAILTWTPNAGALVEGDPAGHFGFRIRARDDDNGSSQQDVSITVVTNNPPPTPPIKYPDGLEPVRTPQPTIILENVDDPDDDAVQYFLEVDYNPCFCSPEFQSSGPLPEGNLVTQWQLPRPFNVDVNAGGNTTFYVRRWASDGLADSTPELSLWTYEAGGGDGDSDVDADGDADGDGDDGRDKAGCLCGTGGRSGDLSGSVATLLFFVLVAVLRLRPRAGSTSTRGSS